MLTGGARIRCVLAGGRCGTRGKKNAAGEMKMGMGSVLGWEWSFEKINSCCPIYLCATHGFELEPVEERLAMLASMHFTSMRACHPLRSLTNDRGIPPRKTLIVVFSSEPELTSSISFPALTTSALLSPCLCPPRLHSSPFPVLDPVGR